MTAGHVKEITSLANPIIKDLRGLMQKKNREREGVFLTEGLKLVLEGLELGGKIRCFIYASAEAAPLAEQAAARAYAAGALIIKTNAKIMAAISHRDNAQSCIGVFEQSWHNAAALLSGAARRADAGSAAAIAAAKAGGRLLLGLDRIRDPGNLGTIIRTADAVGADGIILIGDTVSPYAPEAARATMGSVFALPLARLSEAEFLPLMAGFNGLKVGAHLQGAVDYRSIDYFGLGQSGAAEFAAAAPADKSPAGAPPPGGKIRPLSFSAGAAPAAAAPKPAAAAPSAAANSAAGGPRNVLLLMGNEQSGLTEALAAACTVLARIPQAGRADSLNLAVSTGIMLYEICRPRLHL